MEKTSIYENGTGNLMATALLPEGWKAEAGFLTDEYYGTGNPLAFYVAATCAESGSVLRYLSPANYTDPGDKLKCEPGEILMSDCNRMLYSHFPGVERLSDDFARGYYGDGYKVAFFEQRYPLREHAAEAEALRLKNERACMEQVEKLNAANSGMSITATDYACRTCIRLYGAVSDSGSKEVFALKVTADSVRLNYRGTDENGKRFENSELAWELSDEFLLAAPYECFERDYTVFEAFFSSFEISSYVKDKSASALAKLELEVKESIAKLDAKRSEPVKQMASDEAGLKYARVNLPADWRVSVKRFDSYSGYGCPFSYHIKALSADGTLLVKYLSPLRYEQDFLSPQSDKIHVDDYGNLLRDFMSVEDFLLSCATHDYGEHEDFGLVEKRLPTFAPRADYDAFTKKKFADTQKSYAEKYPDRVLNSNYVNGAVMVFAYKYKGARRKVAYCAVIDAVEYTQYSEINLLPEMKRDPFFVSMLRSTHNGFFIDNRGRFMYLDTHCKLWSVSNRTVCDAPEAAFEALYSGVYTSFCSAYEWQKELNDEISRQQALVNERNKAVREDKAAAKKVYDEMERDRIRAAGERADIARRSNEEIGRIISSTYENSQRSRDRTAERWSDAFRGDQRYTDRYNDEYVVHGTGKYAYRRGDTVINTDDPDPPGWDWEELKKKD